MSRAASPAYPAAVPESGDDYRAAERLYARYRLDVPAPAAWNETLDVLLSHRSVRAYLPDRLPEGTLETLVAAAQSAASSSNLQAWSVVAVEDPARKARLAGFAGNQKHIVEAPLLLVWLVDLARLSRLAEERGAPSEALDYVESFLVGAVDAALAAQSAVVALESLGLGSVYIGAIRNKPAQVAAELGLPPHVFALFGLVVGRPDPARPTAVKPRLPQDAVLFRERYEWTETQRRAVTGYDERIRGFQREEGLAEQSWTVQAGNRVRDAKSLNGRDVLRAILHELGFELK
jgi:nitroreductase